MTLLPFVVQPKSNTEIVRLGSEEIGVVEITRKGYLSVAEKTFVDGVMQGSDGVSSMVLLANRVARENKTTAEKAYVAISDAMQGASGNGLSVVVSDRYSEQIAQITAKMTESIQRRAIAATTILIQTRINHNWTFEDTLKLDPQMLDQFMAFYEREEQREPIAIKDKSKEEEAAEIVGK